MNQLRCTIGTKPAERYRDCHGVDVYQLRVGVYKPKSQPLEVIMCRHLLRLCNRHIPYHGITQ